MKRTKAWLERSLEGAIKFQLMPIVYVRRRDEGYIRDASGFVSVCAYGYGQVPAGTEIGRTNTHRYLLKPRRYV